MRKRLFMLAGVGVMALGLMAGTVMAQDSGESGEKPGLFGRVAALVESGQLTEEQAAELRERLDALPDGFEGFRGPGRRGHGFRSFGSSEGHMFRFEFRDGDGERPDREELRERFESLGGDGDSFELPDGRRGFRFFFGPGLHGSEDEEVVVEVPADATSL